MSNKALNRCRSATDNDEYYTLYEYIESEVKHCDCNRIRERYYR